MIGFIIRFEVFITDFGIVIYCNGNTHTFSLLCISFCVMFVMSVCYYGEKKNDKDEYLLLC